MEVQNLLLLLIWQIEYLLREAPARVMLAASTHLINQNKLFRIRPAFMIDYPSPTSKPGNSMLIRSNPDIGTDPVIA
ncbi:hypothetical protein BC936DRAFT_147484 [Jimgerdemannia flammicorona]|uniref:Uncharacterized protein n=1 Tax=Jimgerdemannia flammicorona TaxID=994334 RepID=A0A433D582_9FUNG|nr:hypothetical protein BC936DRAFT_147484 [Jimgerdemannia flammicorona]